MQYTRRQNDLEPTMALTVAELERSDVAIVQDIIYARKEIAKTLSGQSRREFLNGAAALERVLMRLERAEQEILQAEGCNCMGSVL